MKIRILLMTAMILLLSGCTGVFGPDKEGWRSSQKSEFLTILKTDKYMSICDQKALYAKVRSNRNSQLMTKLLIKYANNLANGCIDLESFKASQREKKAQEIDTHYETYMQKVNKSDIMMKLKAGASIESILKPYIPQTPQFFKLMHSYKSLKKEGNVSTETLYKVRLNIERTKLMKPEMGTHYALINVPEFKVRIIENGKTVLNFAVIVGKSNMQTPIFSERLNMWRSIHSGMYRVRS